MTKHLFLIITCFLVSMSAMSQDKYDDPSFDALKVLKVIDPAGFKPVKLADLERFKAAILSLSSQAFTQLNIDTWSKCTNQQETAFFTYNTYYKKVSRSFFEQNCKALCALMLLDGTLKSR